MRLMLPPIIFEAAFGIDTPDDAHHLMMRRILRTRKAQRMMRAAMTSPNIWTMNDSALSRPYP